MFSQVESPYQDDKSPESWTMFLTIDNNKQKTQKFIKKVVYHLDPCFKNNKITTYHHPFLLSLSHGPFIMKADIIF